MGKLTTTNHDLHVATTGTPHVAMATSPDMCLVPGSKVPQGFPNYVETSRLSAGATTTVVIAGSPVWTSIGEVGPASDPAHPGTDKGISSKTYRAEAKATSYSSDLVIEGNPAVRTGDATTQNHANTVGRVVVGGAAPASTANAPSTVDDRGIVAHPVDVATGRVYTQPVLDLSLPGPLPLIINRLYSSSVASADFGLGHGWTHSLAWELEIGWFGARIYSDEGIAVNFGAAPEPGRSIRGPWGWELTALGDGFILSPGDGIRRSFVRLRPGSPRYVLSELRDAHGNSIVLTRSGGHLVAIRDSVGRIVEVASTPDGRIDSLTLVDPAENRRIVIARYAYDTEGNLASATDALGFSSHYAYDNRHLLVSETDRAGLTFRFVYDARGRCIETWGEYLGSSDPSLDDDLPDTLADGRTPARGVLHTRIRYLPDGSVEAIDSTRVCRFKANRHGLIDESDDGTGAIRRAYDERGRLIARTDQLGATTRIERDALGRIVGLTDALGRHAKVALDAQGVPVVIRDPAGGTTTIARDDRGHVRAVTDASGATSTYAYNDRGLLTEIRDSAGASRSIQYDRHGNAIAAKHATGGVWRWTYDGLGRPVAETDPLGNTTRRVYSARGDLLEVHDPSNGVTRYEYDGEGHPTRVVRPNGQAATLVWGGYHRLCEGRDANGRTIKLRYNREGQLSSLVAPGGEVSRFYHDAAGRLVGVSGFDGGREAIAYDRAGRARCVETPLGNRTEIIYDAANQVVGRRLHDGTIERYEYDDRGGFAYARTAAGELRIERDAVGRVVREAQVVEGEEHWVESLYDSAGNRIQKRTSLGHTETREMAVDASSFSTVLDGEVIRRTVDLLGREIARELSGGTDIESVFDAWGRLARRRVISVRPTRRSAEPARHDDDAPVTRADTRYTYDEAHELIMKVDSILGRTRYAYDRSGYLLSVARDGEEPELFHYNASWRIQRLNEPGEYGPGGRLLRAGATTYSWDAGGRLVEKRASIPGASDAVWRYEWDHADQLARVSTPDGTIVEFLYDPFARRILKRVTRPAGHVGARVITTRFVWDGDVLVHEIRRVDGQLDVVRTYWFMDGSLLPGAHRDVYYENGVRRPGRWFHYVNDAAGAPDRLVTSSGEIACELTKGAWGRATETAPALTTTPLRLLGQYEDEETGLFYNRCRYYDPDVARYISQDPIGFHGGFDLYGYPKNPTGWADPRGLQIIIVPDPRLYGFDPPPPPPPTIVNGPGFLLPVFENEGWFTVNAHANPEGVRIPEPYDTWGSKDGYTQNASDIAKWIRAQPGYSPGMRVLLVACNTGDNTNGIAQRLADELGAPVKGATGFVSGAGPFWLLMNSNYEGLDRLTHWPDGVWRTFYPGKAGKYTEED